MVMTSVELSPYPLSFVTVMTFTPEVRVIIPAVHVEAPVRLPEPPALLDQVPPDTDPVAVPESVQVLVAVAYVGLDDGLVIVTVGVRVTTQVSDA